MSDHREGDLEEKDVSYSPASEKETRVKQDEGTEGSLAENSEKAQVLPGTGGPDDVGEIDVDPEELNAPNGAFPGHA